jgi:putative endonuclease
MSNLSVRRPNRAIGDAYETAALEYLERNGLTLVTRNWRCPQGEIDLVMRDGARLVFIEVRRRSASQFGGALASINPSKTARLWSAINNYLSHLPRRPDFRVDAVTFDSDHTPQWTKSVGA